MGKLRYGIWELEGRKTFYYGRSYRPAVGKFHWLDELVEVGKIVGGGDYPDPQETIQGLID